MKRSELTCPQCYTKLEDLKESMRCNPCDKNYQLVVSKNGLRNFFLLLLPSSFLLSTVFVLNWKVEGVFDFPNGQLVVYGLLAAGFLGFFYSLKRLAGQLEVGDEVKPS